ncbi:MAG TPA: hypothetical protein VG276_07640 [Actinomycetes bacterium]|nr:hypothetical protein [Actinomycetes bacterium]
MLERSTLVPALDQAAYNDGDDFLGSARERLFGFINGQTGADNKQAQGFVHPAKDGHVSEDASAQNIGLIDAFRNGGDLLAAPAGPHKARRAQRPDTQDSGRRPVFG